MPDPYANILAVAIGDTASRVLSIAQSHGIAPAIAEDYLKLTKVESGQNINVGNSPKGARGFGQVMPDVPGGRYRTIGGQKYDLLDPSQNMAAGLSYFNEGGSDPVGRRLHYFGGPGARNHYERTGRIPNISDGNMTAVEYVKATQGDQDPYADVVKAASGQPAPSPTPSGDPYADIMSVASGQPVSTVPQEPGTPAFDLSAAEKALFVQKPAGSTVPLPPLTGYDVAWHLGADPSEVHNWNPAVRKKALMVVQQAVAEDARKRAARQEILPPPLSYQNHMRDLAGLPKIDHAVNLSGAAQLARNLGPLKTGPKAVVVKRQSEDMLRAQVRDQVMAERKQLQQGQAGDQGRMGFSVSQAADSPTAIADEVERRVKIEKDRQIENERLQRDFTSSDRDMEQSAYNSTKSDPSALQGVSIGLDHFGNNFMRLLAAIVSLPSAATGGVSPVGIGSRILADTLRRHALAADMGTERARQELAPSRFREVTQFGAETVGGVATAALANALGGPVAGFASLGGLESLGRNESLEQVFGQTVKGAAIGGVFKFAPFVESEGEAATKALSQRVADLAKSSATIATGTFAVEKAGGASNDDAARAALTNTLFHLSGTVPEAAKRLARGLNITLPERTATGATVLDETQVALQAGEDRAAIKEEFDKLHHSVSQNREPTGESAPGFKEQRSIEGQGPGGIERRGTRVATPEEQVLSQAVGEQGERRMAAETDQLTGLQSQSQWKQAQARVDSDPAREVVILDANDLKTMNDRLGHATGDEYIEYFGKVVREEAERLGISSRQTYRSGGDEIAVDAPKGKGAELVAAVKSRMAEFERGELKGSVAGGVGADSTTADSAMYADKGEMKETAPSTEVQGEPNATSDSSVAANVQAAKLPPARPDEPAHVTEARKRIEDASKAQGSVSEPPSGQRKVEPAATVAPEQTGIISPEESNRLDKITNANKLRVQRLSENQLSQLGVELGLRSRQTTRESILDNTHPDDLRAALDTVTKPKSRVPSLKVTKETPRINATTDKTEKTNRAGFTKAQADYIAGETERYVEHGSVEAITIKVPGDGEFKIATLDQANRLHQRVTGQPVEGMAKAKGATVSSGTQTGRTKAPERTPSAQADRAMELYGEPLVAAAEIRRQMREEESNLAPGEKPSDTYDLLRELEDRARGYHTKYEQSYYGRPRLKRESYDVAAEMKRIGTPRTERGRAMASKETLKIAERYRKAVDERDSLSEQISDLRSDKSDLLKRKTQKGARRAAEIDTEMVSLEEKHTQASQAVERELAAIEKAVESKPGFVEKQVTKAQSRLAQRAAFKEAGGEYRGSGGPDTQPLIDHLLVHGWDVYQSGKKTFSEWSAEMKRRFHEDIEPHLRSVWAQLTGQKDDLDVADRSAEIVQHIEDRNLAGLAESTAEFSPENRTRVQGIVAQIAQEKASGTTETTNRPATETGNQAASKVPGPDQSAETGAASAATVPGEPSTNTTGIKHAIVEAERELAGLPQFAKARRSHGESFDQGVEAVRNGTIDPGVLAIQVADEPRPLSTKESMALLYDRMRISVAKESAAKALEVANESGDAEQINTALDKVHQLETSSGMNDRAVYLAGGEQGRGLAIRRELINRDYSRAVVTAKYVARNRGKALDIDTQELVDSFTDELERAHKRIAELESGQQARESAIDADKFVREQRLEVRRRGRTRKQEEILTERADLKQQLAQVWRKTHGASVQPVGIQAGDIEMARLLGQLARNFIEGGVLKAGDLVDAIHEHVSDVTDLTKRQVSDLISGYGKVKSSTSDVVEKKLNEIKAILAATSGKADILEKNIRAAKRGQQRDKPTEDERRATRELQEAMREFGAKLTDKPYDPKTQQATPLDKAITTARNRGEQLRSWIASGRKEVNGRQQLIPNAELNQLKAENAALEKVVALLNDPEADQKMIDRRVSQLSKLITEGRAKAASGKVSPELKEGAKQPWSPEVGRLESERIALNKEIATIRTEQARKAREEAAAQPAAQEKARQEAIAKRLAAIDQRIADLVSGKAKPEANEGAQSVWSQEISEAERKLAEARRKSVLGASIASERANISSGQVLPETPEGARSIWTPELGAMENERLILKKISNDVQAEAARQAKPEVTLGATGKPFTTRSEEPEPNAGFYGASGSWRDFEIEARRVLNAQRAQAEQAQKKVAQLQATLDEMRKTEQRPAKAVKAPTPETDELKVAKRNAQVLQTNIDQLGEIIDWRNKNVAQKGLAYTAAGVRAGVLTGTRTIGKIGSAIGQSAVQQYLGEPAGEVARQALPRTAALAPRHGQRLNAASEAAFAGGVVSGVKEIPRALRTGETAMTLEHGDHYPSIPTKLGNLLSTPGRVHMAEKNILGSGEYARAKELYLQRAERITPGARDNPDVQQAAGESAYKHAKEIMMLGDNPFSKAMQAVRRTFGKPGGDGQAISRIVVPIERVPSNYVFSHLIGEFGLGLPRGIARGVRSELQLRDALRKAVADTSENYMNGTIDATVAELERRNPGLMKHLSPEESDKTIRLIKRGSVGLIYMTLGGVLPAGAGAIALGGFYGGAGDKKEVKPGDLKLGPVTIPHFLLHSAPNDLANFISTVKREIQSQVAKDKGDSTLERAETGVVQGVKGVIKQVPFLNEYVDAVNSMRDRDAASTQAGKWLATRVEPQIMQELARATDHEETGDRKRKAKGFIQALEMGVPVLRETLPMNDADLEKRNRRDAGRSIVQKERAGESSAEEIQKAKQDGVLNDADIKRLEKSGKITAFRARMENMLRADQLDGLLDYYDQRSSSMTADQLNDLRTVLRRAKLTHAQFPLNWRGTAAQKDQRRERLNKALGDGGAVVPVPTTAPSVVPMAP